MIPEAMVIGCSRLVLKPLARKWHEPWYYSLRQLLEQAAEAHADWDTKLAELLEGCRPPQDWHGRVLVLPRAIRSVRWLWLFRRHYVTTLRFVGGEWVRAERALRYGFGFGDFLVSAETFDGRST